MLPLFIVGLTSVIEVADRDLWFKASSTLDFRFFRGRDFRKSKIMKKLIGNTIRLDATPMNIYKIKYFAYSKNINKVFYLSVI